MQYEFSYTITVFQADKEAKQFAKWYKENWLAKNPKLDDFTLTFDNHEELGDVLEVMSHNPFLSVEALLEIFRGDIGAYDSNMQPGSESIN